ncbi:hypothetical protein BU24DRAFT_356088 [Aaosphaeria arxii CBS 175.79]|uniref:Uncharacterized protein n=1 Tax=Aaosphaeria arxii CBS 175.79 TaxID=1450172 RepID=A0A6A5XBX6_9PLEO|nr:uncharacterized protein BU24DRAFT_356088 [Aaosphaeria arxii CBS 175.79]KAF2010401.1 hypothetical protein BU24DRAFT_356088 [Aaosphaeria arxii CBS 175.79]
MIFKTILLGGLVLAGHASARVNKVNALFQRSDDIEEVLRRDAGLIASLTVRQNANPAGTAPQISTTPASGDASQADLAKWEADTKAACGNALAQLNGRTSSPTGIAVCYNLPFLDNQTGVFQAELRLYNISTPINPWTGVGASDIMVTMSYLGATLQNMNTTTPAKRDMSWPPIKERKEDGLLIVRQSADVPQELKVLSYVGKINDNVMGSAMTETSLRQLLIPSIELIANNPRGGNTLRETLSSSEASFVNGVFANSAASQTENAAAAASSLAAAVQPFYLPGTNLAFFPIGLVITCAWTGFFLLTVGLGTLGRIQFRDQYRRRLKREMAYNVRTI